MAQQVLVKIDLEGKEIKHYTGLKIWQDVFDHHRFEVIVPFEELEKEDEHFFSQSHEAVCGKKITFSFEKGHEVTFSAQNEKFDLIFKGIVTSISLRAQGDLTNSFVLGGYSPTILLEDASLRRIFKQKSVGDVVSEVTGSYASNVLKKTVNANSNETLPYIVQYNETNYEFISRLANEYGEWFYYNGSDMVFGKSDKKEVKFNIDGVQAFDASISLSPTKFKMSAYIYADDRVESTSDGTGSVNGLSQLSEFALKHSDDLFSTEAELKADKVIFTRSELDGIAKAKRAMKASGLVVFKGSGEVPNISVGNVIDVSGTVPSLGGRSNSEKSFGKYLITEIEHTVDAAGNYSNNFKAIPDSVEYPPLNPNVKHPAGYPELAAVTSNEDPDKLGRIKVKFYWPGEQEKIETDWIRVGNFYSGGGDGLGMLFIPEVGAQVVVGYEQNNPEYPFVITSIYPKSSDVRTAARKNEEKFIQTYAGNQIAFNDKQGDNTIEITNKGNPDTSIKLEFASNGVITLTTKGKVNITADEAISLKTNQKLTMEAMDIQIKANNGFKVEATNAAEIKAMQLKLNADANGEVKANAMLKVEGAMVDVKASGITTVGGALVKIN